MYLQKDIIGNFDTDLCWSSTENNQEHGRKQLILVMIMYQFVANHMIQNINIDQLEIFRTILS